MLRNLFSPTNKQTKNVKIIIDSIDNFKFSGFFMKPVKINPPKRAWKLCNGEIEVEIIIERIVL